ncbi:hypothetical protein BDV19DRAFT_366023 [Aspergillus venezuelensis]
MNASACPTRSISPLLGGLANRLPGVLSRHKRQHRGKVVCERSINIEPIPFVFTLVSSESYPYSSFINKWLFKSSRSNHRPVHRTTSTKLYYNFNLNISTSSLRSSPPQWLAPLLPATLSPPPTQTVSVAQRVPSRCLDQAPTTPKQAPRVVAATITPSTTTADTQTTGCSVASAFATLSVTASTGFASRRRAEQPRLSSRTSNLSTHNLLDASDTINRPLDKSENERTNLHHQPSHPAIQSESRLIE